MGQSRRGLIPGSVRDRFYAENALDVELYAYAAARWKRQLESATSRFSQFHAEGATKGWRACHSRPRPVCRVSRESALGQERVFVGRTPAGP